MDVQNCDSQDRASMAASRGINYFLLIRQKPSDNVFDDAD